MNFDIRSVQYGFPWRSVMAAALFFNATIGSHTKADEGGTSFWLPGQYGSFAALAPEPGASLALVSYWYSARANANQPLEFGGDLKLGVDADYFGQFIVPAYTPDTTFLGGRPSFSLAFIPARNEVSADVSVGGVSAAASDEVTGMSDLYPTAQLFWNRGVHNWMAYVAGNIPIGSYDPTIVERHARCIAYDRLVGDLRSGIFILPQELRILQRYVLGHGFETARCAGYAAILTPVAASVSRAFCSALI